MAWWNKWHELNLLIGREVMGWRKVYPRNDDHEHEHWYIDGRVVYLDSCPNFADDMEEMNLVIEAMCGESRFTNFTAKERDWKLVIEGPTTNGKWRAAFYQILDAGHTIGARKFVTADTIPMAVCLAALHMLGVKPGEELLVGQP